MRLLTLLLLIILVPLPETSASDEISIGENFTIHSEIIGEDRPISVYVPKGVNEDDSLYVIYLLDSEHHFHTVTGIVQSLVDYEQIPNTKYQRPWSLGFKQQIDLVTIYLQSMVSLKRSFKLSLSLNGLSQDKITF